MRMQSMAFVSRALRHSVIVPSRDLRRRISSLVVRAADAIGHPDLASTSVVTVADSITGSPFVVGIRKPEIVISLTLLQTLIGQEGQLETALRHELMHIARRDHLVRWIQIALTDISGMLFVSSALNLGAIGMEEQLCDIGAIKEPKDAQHLSRAIVESYIPRSPEHIGLVGVRRQAEMPGLVHFIEKRDGNRRELVRRLTGVLTHAKALGDNGPTASSTGLARSFVFLEYSFRWIVCCALLILLLGIFWARFFVFWMI
jgi:hypothetical protein